MTELTDKLKSQESIKSHDKLFDPAIKVENENGDKKNEISDKNVSFPHRLRTDTLYRKKFIHTLVLCWSFVTYGWVAGMSGPTFPDLRQIIGEDLSTSTWLFTIGSFGFMVGSLVRGFLFDRVNKEFVLTVSFFGLVVSQFLTPYCNTLSLMLVARFVVGVFCGSTDTGCNAAIYYIWSTNGESFMQALHFGFSIGALLAPLATEPFLAKKVNSCINDTIVNASRAPLIAGRYSDYVSKNDTYIPEDMYNMEDCQELYEDTNVHYAFMLSAFLCLTSSIAFMCLCKSGCVYTLVKSESNDNACNIKNCIETKKKKLTISQKIFFLCLICLQIASYSLVEDIFVNFFMTFSLVHLNWNKSLGSFATSAFWIAYAIGRFLGIFITKCCEQSLMLTAYLIFLALGLIGFYISIKLFFIPLIWVFTIILGLAMSVIFPAFFSWTSENIMPVTGKVSSIIFSFLVVVGMAFPLLIGYLMEHFTPMWFVYILLISMAFTLVHFVILRIIVKVTLKNNTTRRETNVTETEMTLIK